jgi:predicted transcriptional regulator
LTSADRICGDVSPDICLPCREPAPSIRAFAGSIGRDYRRVHEDVTALVEAGLIEQHGLRLSVAARSVQARLDLGGEPA